jgi:hypothetical protein
MEKQEALTGLNFGRVDAENDSRFESCFIGTDMLRHVLTPQHSLVLGSKGSGKSAAFRLLTQGKEKVRHLFPKEYKEVYCVPAYGLHNEEDLLGMQIGDLRSRSIDDFRFFWLFYIGIKTLSTVVQHPKFHQFADDQLSEKGELAYATIYHAMEEIGAEPQRSGLQKLARKMSRLVRPAKRIQIPKAEELGVMLSADFRHRTGMSVTALLDNLDIVLRETNSLAWVMLDKLDLLFIDDFEQLKAAITGLVQILVEHSNRFKNIHLKIFLRNDLYRQLRIVNKSHLISYTSEMKWRDELLLKLLVSRAVADDRVRAYCEEVLGEKVDVQTVISGADSYVQKLFYVMFEPSMTESTTTDAAAVPFTHIWMLRHLSDGMDNIYPRELIHLGNLAVEKQREINRRERRYASSSLINAEALREAFIGVSLYRCDTYLYSEFPHLAKHFDLFRGSERATFTRSDLVQMFSRLVPSGDDAIRAVYDTGLLMPLGPSVDASAEFKIPLIYRVGLGVTQRGRARIDSRVPISTDM